MDSGTHTSLFILSLSPAQLEELRNTLAFIIYYGLDESLEVLIDRQECVIMGKLSSKSKHRKFSQNGGIVVLYLVCSIAKPLSSNVSRDNKCKILGLQPVMSVFMTFDHDGQRTALKYLTVVSA
jgi:hypothetical protein